MDCWRQKTSAISKDQGGAAPTTNIGYVRDYNSQLWPVEVLGLYTRQFLVE